VGHKERTAAFEPGDVVRQLHEGRDRRRFVSARFTAASSASAPCSNCIRAIEAVRSSTTVSNCCLAAESRIQLSLGHASIVTTERYLGVRQDLHDAPCDRLGIRLG
jgi:hypothetical protein